MKNHSIKQIVVSFFSREKSEERRFIAAHAYPPSKKLRHWLGENQQNGLKSNQNSSETSKANWINAFF